MKFGVVIFPGSNCDMDLIHALQEITGERVVELWHKDTDLQDCEFVFLPGGFSYGDYLRSGAIAKLSPIMSSVHKHASKGGYVMGICNGFQILCECGLLPGVLLRNENQLFICENVYLKTIQTNTIITRGLSADQIVKIPIAHAEGRFYADKETLEHIENNNMVIFRYADKDGSVNASGNPNGSLANIAGICNKGRNVFGMMPHPERASSEDLFNCDGKSMFEGIVAAMA